MNSDLKYSLHALMLVLMLSLNSCFTGVENTPKITDKDVERTIVELDRRQPSMTLEPYVDSISIWKPGKKFYVTDNQIRLILSNVQDVDMDTIKMAGTVLSYMGMDCVTGVDNRKVVNINLSDGVHSYMYRTGRTADELTSSFSIPLLIDMDMVANIARQIEKKNVYIKTPIWYDSETGSMIHGRQYIKVTIDKVSPGNKVLPLKIEFTASDNGQKAFVWMTNGAMSINNRDYDSLFSSKDIHDSYPEITAANWNLIVHGEVAVSMTKEECRLAKGAPKSISRQPNQAEVREYWYYDGGSYLMFVDGLLSNFRK